MNRLFRSSNERLSHGIMKLQRLHVAYKLLAVGGWKDFFVIEGQFLLLSIVIRLFLDGY